MLKKHMLLCSKLVWSVWRKLA